jgi:hypothetical protein
MPIFQEGYPDGISYCSSSMDYLWIFTSLVGRDLNRKPAHRLFATDSPDTALSLEWQTWLYHVASQHLNCRGCPTGCLSNWLAGTAPYMALQLGLVQRYWQIWNYSLASYNDIGRYGTITWPYTTSLADMALQLDLVQCYWQIWHYNLALHNVIGRYGTTTWPYTTLLADMALQLGLIPLDWQICHYNLACTIQFLRIAMLFAFHRCQPLFRTFWSGKSTCCSYSCKCVDLPGMQVWYIPG